MFSEVNSLCFQKKNWGIGGIGEIGELGRNSSCRPTLWAIVSIPSLRGINLFFKFQITAQKCRSEDIFFLS